MPPPSNGYMLGLFIIVKTVYKLAKRSFPRQEKRRGPKNYSTSARIAVLTWVTLHGRSYRRALDDLSKLGIHRRLGLKNGPSPASISR